MWRDLFTTSLDSASLDDGFIFRQTYSFTSSWLAPLRPAAPPHFRNPGSRKPLFQWSQQSPVLSLIGPLGHLPTCKPITGAGFDGVRGEIHGLAWSALTHAD